MAATTYQYSVSTDTLNGIVDALSLKKTIQASSITIALDKVVVTADDLEIVMKDVLDSGDVGILDSLVTVHDGISAVDVMKVHEITTKDPNVDLTLTITGAFLVCNLADSTGNIDTHVDVVFSETRELQGATCWIKDCSMGDYVEMTLHAPNSAETELQKFGEMVYAPPDGHIMHDPSTGTDVIPAGYIIRFTYTSTGTTGPQPTLICHVRSHK